MRVTLTAGLTPNINNTPSNINKDNLKYFEARIFTKGTFSVCINFEGIAYIWGSNNSGELGFNDSIPRLSPTPFPLPSNERIKFVSCAFFYGMCLTENDNCYIWGENNFQERQTPKKFSLPLHEKISFIACGSYHTICLTQNNLCYVWGNNEYGQLGLGDKKDREHPTSLTLPNNERIIYITSGFVHTMCLTENNSCYVWGDNEYGKLGLGDETNALSPVLLSLPNPDESISLVSCGQNHSMCLSSVHLCYVWGSNEFGELGLNDDPYIKCFRPTLLILPDKEKAFFITSSDNHNVCLTENNLCYVWGRNDFGQLGLGDKEHRYSPVLLTLPNNERISFITSGSDHNICLTESGNCYVWGYNENGELGLGTTAHCINPTFLSFLSLKNKNSN